MIRVEWLRRAERVLLPAALLLAPIGMRAQAVIEPRGIQLSATSLVSGRDGPMRILVAMSRPLGANDTVPMRVLLASLTSTDTVLVWAGRTGQTPVWDGTINGTLIASGRYDLVAEVQSAGRLNRVRRAVAITVEPMPGVGNAPLPEFSVTQVADAERQSTRTRSALTRIAIGVVLGVGGAALVQPAIDNTAPKSPARWAVAASYGAGIVVTANGLFSLYNAITRPSVVTVNLPLEANIAANRASDAMAKWRRITLRFLEEDAR
jgi:hypothetical protein